MHIRDSLMIAQADRIGHGLFLKFEEQEKEILEFMK
jgi:hypothetical protein